jgi:hypothetical protein
VDTANHTPEFSAPHHTLIIGKAAGVAASMAIAAGKPFREIRTLTRKRLSHGAVMEYRPGEPKPSYKGFIAQNGEDRPGGDLGARTSQDRAAEDDYSFFLPGQPNFLNSHFVIISDQSGWMGKRFSACIFRRSLQVA